MIIHAAEKGDVVFAQTDVEKQVPYVFLGSDRLGKHHGLTTSPTVPPQIENHFDGVLK